jgi:hypothetical protein
MILCQNHVLSHKSTPLRDDAGVISMPLVGKVRKKKRAWVPRAEAYQHVNKTGCYIHKYPQRFT